MRISVVIPTYNRGDLLAETIILALAQDYFDFEVIVVDQSADTTPAVLRLTESAPPRLRYIRLSKPNLPGARNAGVCAATGEIISFIDDDVVIGREYLSGMAANFCDPQVGGAMGMTLSADGHEPEHSGVLRQYSPSQEHADGTASVGWIIGCNSSYRKQAIIDAGMCDEKFTLSAWAEDVDLSVRVRNAGYRLNYDPRVRLIHLHLTTGGCANRDSADAESRDEHKFRLMLYFAFKNRAILGRVELLRNVWRVYRSYAFYRALLWDGVKLINRHYRFTRAIAAALAMCGENQLSSGSRLNL